MQFSKEGSNVIPWDNLDFSKDDIADRLADELMLRGYEAEDLAAWIGAKHFPSFLKAWAHQFVLQTRPMLEEVIRFNERVEGMLEDPRKFFNTNEEEARNLVVDYFSQAVNGCSPEYVKRAMIAHIELGLGNFVFAAEQAGFAMNNKEVEDFGEKIAIGESMPEDARKSLFRVERSKAKSLAELVVEFRKNTPVS